MKKIFSLLLVSVMMACLFFGCSKNSLQEQNKKTIVCSIFPVYDWVNNIVGNKNLSVDVFLLMDKGIDPHSFQPSAADIVKISTCDVFIYVGGESDEWVQNVLENATNKKIVAINLLEILGSDAKEEEFVQGMQIEHEHDHGHDDEHGHEDEHDHENEAEHEHNEVEYDEHVWLSIRNTITFCNQIAQQIYILDSENAEKYSANVNDYVQNLLELDAEYQEVVNTAKNKVVLFGDRFPFRYLVNDYNLSYYAAFVGCSAETEASFETIVFLANKLDELKLNYVLTIEGNKHKIAQTIVQNTISKNQKILCMNSMQSITKKDIKNGDSYISIMKNNLEVLKTVLN